MKSILFLCVISISALSACIDQVDDDQAGTTDEPRLAANGIAPSDILSTNLDQAALTGAAIDPYAVTSSGNRFIGYLVECALDASQSVTSTTAPVKTYTGVYGLATGWTGGALSASSRRWVSACMLARVNASGLNVNISMRGSHAALATIPVELTDWNLQEATFYGDIFVGTNIRRACADVDTLTRPTVGTLPLRVCGRAAAGKNPTTTQCAYGYDGDCAARCTTGSNGYTSCTDLTSTTWNEVIKVNLLGN
jgi:hypothetical protein